MNKETKKYTSAAPQGGGRQKSCPVGGCGSGKGMCPGIALGIGLLIGSGVSALTGIEWLSLPITIVVGLLLILGFYPTGGNWPFRSKPM